VATQRAQAMIACVCVCLRARVRRGSYDDALM
jgi:hypothetical protein